MLLNDSIIHFVVPEFDDADLKKRRADPTYDIPVKMCELITLKNRKIDFFNRARLHCVDRDMTGNDLDCYLQQFKVIFDVEKV